MAKVGFIGAGRMGSALVTGFLNKGLLNRDDVIAYDINPARVSALGVATQYSAFEVVEKCDVVFLCVKPKDMDAVLDEIEDVTGTRLVVSIAAGITCQHIQDRLREARVVRVMPNTPAVLFELAAAYCLGDRATEEDDVFVGSLLNSLGVAFRVDEDLMDAVTGLSGSGPAYVYYFIKSMVEAGVAQGLSEKVALNLTLQTFRGAVDMVIVTKREPDDLIDEVKSPGGTTEEGLKTLDRHKVRQSIAKAVDAATKKSVELSQGPTKKARGRKGVRP